MVLALGPDVFFLREGETSCEMVREKRKKPFGSKRRESHATIGVN